MPFCRRRTWVLSLPFPMKAVQPQNHYSWIGQLGEELPLQPLGWIYSGSTNILATARKLHSIKIRAPFSSLPCGWNTILLCNWQLQMYNGPISPFKKETPQAIREISTLHFKDVSPVYSQKSVLYHDCHMWKVGRKEEADLEWLHMAKTRISVTKRNIPLE